MHTCTFFRSRLTNYVGILSEGLRIAPPSAPVTGYMFGKGQSKQLGEGGCGTVHANGHHTL